MEILKYSARGRAELYALEHDLAIEEPPLGAGQDGIVLATSKKTAIKSFNFPQLYRQEKAVYLHLDAKKLTSLSGFQIPKLVNIDDTNCIIEMTVVSAPYVVDFAQAALKKPAPMDSEFYDEWLKETMEDFGDDWPRVRSLVFAFECQGVYLTDLAPRNIRCRSN